MIGEQPPEVSASGDRAMAAGGSIGVAISGDNTRVVLLPPEAVHWARTVQAPAGAGYLSGSASGVFVGREDELTDLRRMLTGQGTAAVTQAPVRAIHGLGGVGKSTLALQYAHRYRREYTLVWWITAESAESIVKSLSGLAMSLCPQWAGSAGPDERAAWSILWLQEHPDWLLIFDNIENPAHLQPYLGTLHRGHHLATSRKATGWHALAPVMSLGLLPLDKATDLLCTLAFPNDTATDRDRYAARALARDLGCLPLALEQAGAYAFQTGTDLDTYRESLGLYLNESAEGIDPERTIAVIWDHTIAAIADRDPLAVTLLNAMAWLAPDDIPRSLLAPLAPTPIALANALGVLHTYNMVAFITKRTVSIHRLVQTVLSTRGAPPRGRDDAERAVHKAIPTGAEDRATSEQWQQLLPHITALAESVQLDHTDANETRSAYNEAAQYLRRQGRDAHTILLRQAVLAHNEQVLGDTHPDTLASRNNLALAYQAAGNLKQAIPLLKTTLTQSEQTLGDTHPDTLNTRNNLAAAYQTAGNLKQAIPLYETTLTQREQTLGDTHPDTLASRNNLAAAYEEAGDLNQAISLYETTLTQREQTLGDTHPDTLNTRNNLALAYQTAGDLNQAIPLYETTLTQSEQTLGDTHPNTLASRNNLAAAYRAAGDLNRAISLYETTLTQREQTLGDTHPNTLNTRNNLALAYEEAGDLNRAIPLLVTALRQCEQILGHDHPTTLIFRDNLAYARRQLSA
ncbi:tetratricopeptide repeat protein [Streptomyces sp. DSM 40750]|uniref:tetratricopeptide repeat protein n=1 Tax=Streptomyces sp. DSM 40750 TaxID=2801030 RepID=UPI00214AEAED|nr:tetratricopeptide repeat protein [Streptomyces sp. DSM 40750]UUU23537.1 tetratricopeptide repeat protein [Streptomyces sp. DSM 40750]